MIHGVYKRNTFFLLVTKIYKLKNILFPSTLGLRPTGRFTTDCLTTDAYTCD